MLSTIFLALSIAIVLLLFFPSRKNKWKNSPPGPISLPIIGNVLQMERRMHKSYYKWAKKYGPIVRTNLAGNDVLTINDYKLAKELFSQPVFSGRPELKAFDLIGNDFIHGVANNNHPEELRRFILRQISNFGKSMEDSIMREVCEFLEVLKESNGKPVSDVKDRLLFYVINSLWASVTGKRYKRSDDALLTMTKDAQELFSSYTTILLIIFPWLAKIAPRLSGYNALRKTLNGFAEIFRQPITEHKAAVEEDYDKDIIDAYLKECKKTKDPKSQFFGQLGEDNLVGCLGDLHFAGSDTTTSTLTFMILYLSKMPEIQKKLQAEIKAITGNSRPVCLEDRSKMPFAQALIAETLRYSSIVPMGVNHRTVKDTEFKGYHIPKDCFINSNLYYIHHNPEIWGDPENFKPERFLSEDGSTFKKHEALIPFSVGRRQCLGKRVAEDNLFLFGTNIFQKFSVEFDKNGPDNGFESELTFVLTPKPFSVIFKERLL